MSGGSGEQQRAGSAVDVARPLWKHVKDGLEAGKEAGVSGRVESEI